MAPILYFGAVAAILFFAMRAGCGDCAMGRIGTGAARLPVQPRGVACPDIPTPPAVSGHGWNRHRFAPPDRGKRAAHLDRLRPVPRLQTVARPQPQALHRHHNI